MDFLKIYGVKIVLSEMGVEITPLIRYLAKQPKVVNFSFFLSQSGEKRGMISIGGEKVTNGYGFITFATLDDLREEISIVAEANGEKSIYNFFYRQGEVFPKF